MPADDRAQAAAFRAAISAHMGDWDAYDFGKLPRDASGKVPPIHVLTTVARRFGGNRRVSGNLRGTGWVGTATAVGTTADECRRAVEAVAQIENARFTVSGFVSTPVSFQTATSVVPDDGMFSATSTWTWAF